MSRMLENNCVVCYNKNIEVYSVGECDHPVCFECSTRMRVLCRQNECPICRSEMSVVVFTKKICPFNSLKKKYPLFDKTYRIAFTSNYIQNAFNHLLTHECKICSKHLVFASFEELNNHMNTMHEAYCCDICLEHLKILPRERRWYTRNELARHKRNGDPDNRSHRGHPLCKFCNERYLDNDELYRHLRRNHYYCHICDIEGVQGFYGTYESLRSHYKKEHFLCEEGDCVREEFTSVFASDLDLKTHTALVHAKGKQKNRFARIELHFSLAPRQLMANRPGQRRQAESAPNEEVQTDCPNRLDGSSAPSWTESVPSLEAAFPTLGGVPPPVPMRRMPTKTTKNRLAITDENFPVLTTAELPTTNDPNSAPSTSSMSRGSSSSVLHSAPSTSSISITSSSSQSGKNKKRVTKIVHINQPVDEPSTSAVTSVPSASNWPPKNKETAPKVDKKRDTEREKQKVTREDFPSLAAPSTSGEQKSRNKKSSVTVQMNGVSSATGLGDIRSKGKKDKNTEEKELSKSTNHKKVKMKSKEAASSLTNSVNGTVSCSTNRKSRRGNAEYSKNESCKGQAEKAKQQSKKKPDSSNVELPEPPSSKGKSQKGKSNDENLAEKMVNLLGGSSLPPQDKKVKNRNLKSTNISDPSTSFEAGNSLTFTNSLGQSYSVQSENIQKPSSKKLSNEYLPPLNFHERNAQLLKNIEAGLKKQTKEALTEFKNISSLYKDKYITAAAYYSFCKENISKDKFPKIFLELLVLLPNISKQHDLWAFYLMDEKTFGAAASSLITICTRCYQILLANELMAHLLHH